MGVKCAIKGCRSVYSNNNHSRLIRFLRFPHPIHEVQLNQWKLACNDDNIINENMEVGHVKIDESAPNYRIDVISKSIGIQTDLLTVDKGTQTCYVDTSDCEIQTEKELSARTTRKLKLKKEIKEQKANMKLKDKEKARPQLLYDKQVNQGDEIFKASFKNACDDHLPDFFGNMAKHVSDLKDQKLKGRKYTVEFKRHALSIYYQSPRLYKCLAQKYHFPSISTLKRITGNIQQPLREI